MDTKTDSVAQPSPMLPEKLFGDPGDRNAVVDEFGRFWFFVKGEMRQEMIRRWNSHTKLLAACKVIALNSKVVEELSTFDPKALAQVRAAIADAEKGV